MKVYNYTRLLLLISILTVSACSASADVSYNQGENKTLEAIVKNNTSTESPFFIHIKPNRCIALRQGQNCYQKIRFTWRTPDSGNYCLVRASSNKELICWKGNSTTRFNYKFESKTSDVFHIIKGNNMEAPLLSYRMEVAWVYKKTKKVTTGWRLF